MILSGHVPIIRFLHSFRSHFFRYATTTGSEHGDHHCQQHGDWGHTSQTGEAVPVSRVHGLGLSYGGALLADDSARFYTWIWRELVDRGLLELVARVAVRVIDANDERWDVPSEKLKKLVAIKLSPSMEDCPRCPHHAHVGNCGLQHSNSKNRLEICECKGVVK